MMLCKKLPEDLRKLDACTWQCAEKMNEDLKAKLKAIEKWKERLKRSKASS